MVLKVFEKTFEFLDNYENLFYAGLLPVGTRLIGYYEDFSGTFTVQKIGCPSYKYGVKDGVVISNEETVKKAFGRDKD